MNKVNYLFLDILVALVSSFLQDMLPCPDVCLVLMLGPVRKSLLSAASR